MIAEAHISVRDLPPEDRFWASVALRGLKNVRGTIWGIRLLRWAVRWSGIKTAWLPAPSSRCLREIITCRMENVPSVGIMHGWSTLAYSPYEFLLGFSGQRPIGPDVFGVWNDRFLNYFLRYSDVFRPEQVEVSGLLRPLAPECCPVDRPDIPPPTPLRVLWISEPLAVPEQIVHYLEAALSKANWKVLLKTRPMIDDPFSAWLKRKRPDLFKMIDILSCPIHGAVSQSHVVVGSHSTAVLEALLQFRPVVLLNTPKWRDFFEVLTEASSARGISFVCTPEEMVAAIRRSQEVPIKDLRRLRDEYWGDPTLNGGKWVVDRLVAFMDEARDGHREAFYQV